MVKYFVSELQICNKKNKEFLIIVQMSIWHKEKMYLIKTQKESIHILSSQTILFFALYRINLNASFRYDMYNDHYMQIGENRNILIFKLNKYFPWLNEHSSALTVKTIFMKMTVSTLKSK